MSPARVLLSSALLSLSACALIQKELGAAVPRQCVGLDKREPSWEEERSVGNALAVGLVSRFGGTTIDATPDGGTLPDTPNNQLNRAVAEVGLTVAAASPRAAIPWTFAVVDNPGANAWSTPGGYVLVTKGLLAKVSSESQLAGVLAHEVAHTSLRHALHAYRDIKYGACITEKQLTTTIGNVDPKVGGKRVLGTEKSLGSTVTDVAMNKVFEPTIDFIVSKALAPGDEYAADAMAVDLLVMAGYDPREYIAFVGGLPAEKGAFANHPKPVERTRRLTEHLEKQWRDFGWEQHPKVPLDPRIVNAVKASAAR